ncbi:MAG: Wzz/FepE/Etk N-terminal domain-containing protein [Anaerolineales bacterium]
MTVYEYEDEIDLRPYLLNIVKHWWQIGLIVIFSVSAALAYGLTRSRNYESTATILVTRSRAVLSLANQFPTVNEPVDYRSRMEAFQSIASSDGVALKTIKQLPDRQPIASQQLEDFKRSTEISSSGDIIKVTSTAKNPQLAAQIANTWARQAVTAINQAYSGEELPGEIQSQIQAAQQEYQQAQTSLESFMQENQISLLQKQLEEAEGVLDTLVKERMRKIAYFSQRGENMDQM